MEFHRGAAALAAFQSDKLLTQLRKICPQIEKLEASYVHFFEHGDLTDTERYTLEALLSYGAGETTETAGVSVTVVPRLGTTSPWSSKASDILANCGLAKVGRIERGIRYGFSGEGVTADLIRPALDLLYDPMVESVVQDEAQLSEVFADAKPGELLEIDVLTKGAEAIRIADADLGLALVDDEVAYLVEAFGSLGRNPTDAELMMFSVVNSEHCRHKVFNASWTIDDQAQPKSLFKMIKNTHENFSTGIKSAYHDNGAVLAGKEGEFFHPDSDGTYSATSGSVDIVIKVETHNHPTAIAPVPGAATGSGGEIRDEGATGRGAKPKAGLTGFSVSNLLLDETDTPWEDDIGKPDRLVSSQQVMIDGPLGGAAFNNEFGRPNLGGYFRSFQKKADGFSWGYHKPVMLAGGLGAIRPDTVAKNQIEPGDKLIVLGGPSMLIGLGGGAGSSVALGSQSAELDFASVQRHNPEMQRRCQEVINSCWSLGADKNPIVSIHDVGAGGLSNAMPELVDDAGLGAIIELRDIPSDDNAMSPMQIWSNESQERYVLAVRPHDLDRFGEICDREKCPYAVLGQATTDRHLRVTDSLLGDDVVDVKTEVMLGHPPKMERSYKTSNAKASSVDTSGLSLDTVIPAVLSHPSVANKEFLIHIGDRTVGGMTARDQLVGPWQVAVADAAVTHNSFTTYSGEAMAMGERSPVAVLDAAASGRLGVAEAVTNLLCADIANISDIKLSANWMVAADSDGQNQALFETVKSLGEDFCTELNLTIPVGKDSTSMRASWSADDGSDQSVVSPLTVVITGFAPVNDVRRTLTPEIAAGSDSVLVLLPATEKAGNLGGSILEQVTELDAAPVPDVNAGDLKSLFSAITTLKAQNIVQAYHDRSDGGLLAALVEMGFAAQTGIDIQLDSEDREVVEQLFNESIGSVIEISNTDLDAVKEIYPAARVVGHPNNDQQVRIINASGDELFVQDLFELKRVWSANSYAIKRLRDNPLSATQEQQQIDSGNKGLSAKVTFSHPSFDDVKPDRSLKVAILREQGVNGHVEMAAAFHAAGFSSVDVHMTDLKNGVHDLSDFVGLAAAGGFSYGDVLGAGSGWAQSILLDNKLRQMFKTFFEQPNTFSLGLCNGCQMFSQLAEIIPGAQSWPSFDQNESRRFEARLTTMELLESPSIFLKGMEGSRLQVPIAHGEGRAVGAESDSVVAARYVDNNGAATTTYPFNPNGSAGGANAFTSTDGRSMIMMPHPERAFRTSQLSWHPQGWGEASPWFQMFQNAFKWAKSKK